MTQIANGIIKLSYNISSKHFISFHVDIYHSHYYHFYLCDYLIHAQLFLRLGFLFVSAHYHIPLPRLNALHRIDEAEDTGRLQTIQGPMGSALIFTLVTFCRNVTISKENEENSPLFLHYHRAQKGNSRVVVHQCVCVYVYQ